jgi:hypothetical protein
MYKSCFLPNSHKKLKSLRIKIVEEWKSIVGYESLYEVSNLGRIRDNDKNILTEKLNKNGYVYVILKNVRTSQHLVHRLVLQTFFPIDKKMDCDHINHNPSDNRLKNLRWVSRSQNVRYCRKSKNCSSIYKGVSWVKPMNKWKAYCSLHGKQIRLGLFDDECEAGKVYNNFVIFNNLQDFSILNKI